MNAFKNWLELECCVCGEKLTDRDIVCIASKIGVDEPAHCDCVDEVVFELNELAAYQQAEWEASR